MSNMFNIIDRLNELEKLDKLMSEVECDYNWYEYKIDNLKETIEVLEKHIVVINSRVCNKQFHIVATHIFHFFELLVASFSDTLRKL